MTTTKPANVPPLQTEFKGHKLLVREVPRFGKRYYVDWKMICSRCGHDISGTRTVSQNPKGELTVLQAFVPNDDKSIHVGGKAMNKGAGWRCPECAGADSEVTEKAVEEPVTADEPVKEELSAPPVTSRCNVCGQDDHWRPACPVAARLYDEGKRGDDAALVAENNDLKRRVEELEHNCSLYSTSAAKYKEICDEFLAENQALKAKLATQEKNLENLPPMTLFVGTPHRKLLDMAVDNAVPAEIFRGAAYMLLETMKDGDA